MMKVTVELENGDYVEVTGEYIQFEPTVGEGIVAFRDEKEQVRQLKVLLGRNKDIPVDLLDILLK